MVFLAALLPLLGLTFSTLSAQDGGPIVTVAIPEWWQNSGGTGSFSDLARRYEDETPGVRINVVYAQDPYYFLGGDDDLISMHLDSVRDYVTSADVVYVSSSSFGVEATRAGYFLDLNPLVQSDAAMNVDDFIPAAWQSFQWDRGVWAIPAGVTPLVLMYNPDAFDAAGLGYPNEFWTAADFGNAITTLAQFDADGNITLPAMLLFGNRQYIWLYSLLGGGVVDTSVVPAEPLFNTPQAAEFVTLWSDVIASGALDYPQGTFNWDDQPMMLDSTAVLGSSFNTTDWVGTLLPGGVSGVEAQGFAVSSGTQLPDEAYAFARWLSYQPEMLNNFFGAVPARRSVTTDVNDFLDFSPEEEALVQQALDSAVPASDLLFMSYLDYALNQVRNGEADAATALQNAENNVYQALEIAQTRRSGGVVSVSTPVPTPVLSAGEISINFNLQSFVSPLPNREEWDQFIADFIASDPQVGNVVLSSGFSGNPEETAQTNDCFYMPYNMVPDLAEGVVLNLDPFLSADPDFDRNDFFAGVLAQLSRDNRVMAYPLVLQPEALWYNTDLFAAAGAFDPANGWTIEQFIDALRLLRLNPDDPVPFVPRDSSSTYLLMLIAAYGGLPIDYRTSPVTLNFSDPAALDAIRQVLDLARDGYIQYSELANFGGGFGGGGSELTEPIFSQTLLGMSYTFGDYPGAPGSADSPYRLTTYPVGSLYTPVAYTIGTAYISAQTAAPEACYRFISALASRVDLFGSMPARVSQLSDPLLLESQPEAAIAYYQQFGALLQNPNVVVFPSGFFGSGASMGLGYFFSLNWMNRAFDNYVLHDGDLEADLALAAQYSTELEVCLAALPEFDMSWTDEEMEQYGNDYQNCVLSIDPTLGTMFGISTDE